MYRLYLLILFLLICTPAYVIIRADEPAPSEPDKFAGINAGDNVQITLKNRNIFKGTVEELTDSSIRLDISNYDDKMTGSVVLTKSQIKRIKHLDALTDAAIQEIEDKRTRFIRQYSAGSANPTVKKEESETEDAQTATQTLLEKFPPEKGWGKEKYNELLQTPEGKLSDDEKEFIDKYEDWVLEKKQAENKKSEDLLKKFPAEKGWGQEKYDTLSTQFVRIGISLTDEEQEFVDKFDDWKKAKETADKNSAEAGKAAAEETSEATEPSPQAQPAKEQPAATSPQSSPRTPEDKAPAQPSAEPKQPAPKPAQPTGPPPLKPPTQPPGPSSGH